VQFTVVEKKDPLELLQFIQKYNLGNSVPNIVIMLGFSRNCRWCCYLREEFFETKTVQELLKIWHEHFAVEKSCLTVYSATVDR